MGLYIISYGVDLAKLKQAFASANEVLFEEICATDTFEGYASQDFPGATSTAEALRQIIYGEQYDYQSSHSYGYALICLCSYFGVDLTAGVEIKLGYVTDLVDEYLVSDFAIEGFACAEDLLAETPDLGLPPIVDFPAVGMLSAAEIQSLHHLLAPIGITGAQIGSLLAGGSDDEEKGIAYEVIKAIKDGIDYCHQQQLVLLSFCH